MATICLDDGTAGGDGSSSPQMMMMTTYDDIVQRYVYADAAGFTHCQLSDGRACKYSQPGFNATSFLRHFRVAHPVLWKEIEQQKDNVDNHHGNKLVAWGPATTAVQRQSPILTNGSSNLSNNSTAKGTKRRLQTNDDVLDDDHEDEAWIQTPSEDLASYCRLCFSIVELQPVFADARDTNVSLTLLISSCTGIQLTPKTDYPSSICRECNVKLLEIQRFRRLCQTLNRVVRRTVATSKATTLPPPPAPVVTAVASIQPSVTPVVTLIATVSPPPPPSPPPVIELEDDDVVQEAYYIDSPKLEGGEDDDIVFISDETPTISNGPSAANAGDLEDDQPYTKLPDNWFCCRLCNRIYETLPTMMNHFRNNHKESVQVLSIPKAGSSSATTHNNYTAVTIGSESLLKCNSCDSLFKSRSTHTRHWIRFHIGGGLPTDSKIPCPIGACDAFFMERSGFRRHLHLIHGYDPNRSEVTSRNSRVAGGKK